MLTSHVALKRCFNEHPEPVVVGMQCVLSGLVNEWMIETPHEVISTKKKDSSYLLWKNTSHIPKNKASNKTVNSIRIRLKGIFSDRDTSDGGCLGISQASHFSQSHCISLCLSWIPWRWSLQEMPSVCQGACDCNRSFSSSAFSFFYVWSALPCRKAKMIFLCVWDIELWGDCWRHHLSSILKVVLLIRIRVDEKLESVFSVIKLTWQQRAKFSTEWEIRLFVHVRESIV